MQILAPKHRVFLRPWKDKYLFYSQRTIYKCDENFKIIEEKKIDKKDIHPDLEFNIEVYPKNYHAYGDERYHHFITERFYDQINEEHVYISNIYDNIYSFHEDRIEFLAHIPSFSCQDRIYQKITIIGQHIYVSNGVDVFVYNFYTKELTKILSFNSQQVRILSLNNLLLIRDIQNEHIYFLNANGQAEQLFKGNQNIARFNFLLKIENAIIGYQQEQSIHSGLISLIYQDENDIQFLMTDIQFSNLNAAMKLKNGRYYLDIEEHLTGYIKNIDFKQLSAKCTYPNGLLINYSFWDKYLQTRDVKSLKALLPIYNQEYLLQSIIANKETENLIFCIQHGLFMNITLDTYAQCIKQLYEIRNECDLSKYFKINILNNPNTLKYILSDALDDDMIQLFIDSTILGQNILLDFAKQLQFKKKDYERLIKIYQDEQYKYILQNIFTQAVQCANIELLYILPGILPSKTTINEFPVLHYLIMQNQCDKKIELIKIYCPKFKGQVNDDGETDLMLCCKHCQVLCYMFYDQANQVDKDGKSAIYYLLESNTWSYSYQEEQISTEDAQLNSDRIEDLEQMFQSKANISQVLFSIYKQLLNMEYTIVLPDGNNVLYALVNSGKYDKTISYTIKQQPKLCCSTNLEGRYAAQLYFYLYSAVHDELFEAEKQILIARPIPGITNYIQLYDEYFKRSFIHKTVAAFSKPQVQLKQNNDKKEGEEIKYLFENDYFNRSTGLLWSIQQCYNQTTEIKDVDVFGRNVQDYMRIGRILCLLE